MDLGSSVGAGRGGGQTLGGRRLLRCLFWTGAQGDWPTRFITQQSSVLADALPPPITPKDGASVPPPKAWPGAWEPALA